MKNIINQAWNTVKTVATKVAPVAKILGGAAIIAAGVCVGVKHYNDRHNTINDKTMEDLPPIDEPVEEVNE